MAITREKKVAITDKVSGIVADSGSVVFVNFHGLSADETNELRAKMKSENVGYTVAKKTLVKRVLKDASLPGEEPQLDGELALAYGEDFVAPAREIHAFAKTHAGKVSILGGVFDGKLMSREEMMTVATIPSLQTLYAQVTNLINSPLQGLVMALDQVAQKKEA